VGVFLLLGIVAGIIALTKGHTTFAIIMFVWFALGLILYLCGYQFASVPGWIFLIIAICMKRIIHDYPDESPLAWENGHTEKEIKELEGLLTPTFVPSEKLSEEIKKAKDHYSGVTEEDKKNPLYFCFEDYHLFSVAKIANSIDENDARIPRLATSIVSRYEYIKASRQEYPYPDSYFEWARRSYYNECGMSQRSTIARQPIVEQANKGIGEPPECTKQTKFVPASFGKSEGAATAPGQRQKTKNNEADTSIEDLPKGNKPSQHETIILEKSVMDEPPAVCEKSVSPPPIRFCYKCGFELLPGSAFCSVCGAKINNTQP